MENERPQAQVVEEEKEIYRKIAITLPGLAGAINDVLEEATGETIGFGLIALRFHGKKQAHYISNIAPEDLARSLLEAAENIKKAAKRPEQFYEDWAEITKDKPEG